VSPESIDPTLFDDLWNAEIEADVAALQGPIFVVGASGFIGARLFYSLAKRRSDVYAVSRDPTTSWRFKSLPSFVTPRHLVSMDLTDAETVTLTLSKYRPRTVFNLSAYGAYERQKDAVRIHQTNYLGTLNLVLGLREIGCDAFVNAGSSSEYGLNCANAAEDSELVPNSDYAVSKVASSYLLKYEGKLNGFQCAHIRLYSIYGPFEERDRLIPRVVQMGLRGTYPPLAGPSTSRDFVYVDDATAGLVRAARTVCHSQPGVTLNLCTGKRTTLEEVALAAKRVFTLSDAPQFGSHPPRKWDLSNWYGNPTRATAALKWTPTVSFEEGLRHTAQWEEKAAPLFHASPAPDSHKVISLIVACYRDAQAIPVMHERVVKTFEKLKLKGYSYELIFVNDCSPADDEQAIARICAKDPSVIGISHSRNFGSQSAFLSGLEACSGDAAVLLDGDLQDPPELVEQFVDAWEKGADIVYGERVKRDAPLHMQLAYKLFYRVFRKLSEVTIPVDAGDFSLMNRKAIEQLVSLKERDVFLRGLRAWVGFRQTGVPYVRPERMFGVTTNSLLKNIWWAKKAIFSFSTRPLAYIQGLGIALFGATVLGALFYFIYYFIKPPENASGITTVVLLILALGGVQLFSLSILGDYLGKVLEEVKNRPRFIRNRILRNNRMLATASEVDEFVTKNRLKIQSR
jgi:polyisoprenyl-phosphate glycosyltransferase